MWWPPFVSWNTIVYFWNTSNLTNQNAGNSWGVKDLKRKSLRVHIVANLILNKQKDNKNSIKENINLIFNFLVDNTIHLYFTISIIFLQLFSHLYLVDIGVHPLVWLYLLMASKIFESVLVVNTSISLAFELVGRTVNLVWYLFKGQLLAIGKVLL